MFVQNVVKKGYCIETNVNGVIRKLFLCAESEEAAKKQLSAEERKGLIAIKEND